MFTRSLLTRNQRALVRRARVFVLEFVIVFVACAVWTLALSLI